MRIVAIIPSRYESSRFLGKSLVSIDGKPMIQHVYEKMSKIKDLDCVYVATDDSRIKDEVNDFDGNVVMTSSNHYSGTDRVAEAANKIGLSDKDLIVNIQGDQPFINAKTIKFLIKPFFYKKKFDMTTLVYPFFYYKTEHYKNDVKVIINSKGLAIYFSREIIPCDRDKNKTYLFYKHLGLYAYSKNFLDIFSSLKISRLEQIEMLEQLRPIEYGYRIFAVISPYDSIEVDTRKDLLKLKKKSFFIPFL